jgi:hypothetical protein
VSLLPCELRILFDYNPDTGWLSWKPGFRKHRNGAQAGSVDSRGRLRVEVRGRSYGAHQIAFAIHHGRWPQSQIDHINHIKTDNRIANLREATNTENSRNRPRKTGKAGFRGVSLHKGRYIARIMVDGHSINLGSFASPSDAASAYQSAARLYHGDFACPTN